MAGTDPAAILEHIARHADQVRGELPRLAADRGLPISHVGSFVGRALSFARSSVTDVFMSRNATYRATLLGMLHGVHVVGLIEHLARTQGDVSLAAWCNAWLDVRRPLVSSATAALDWFAEHPADALRLRRVHMVDLLDATT